MVTINLEDKNVVENFKALNELRKTGLFTDEQLQQMYDKQVEADMECDEEEMQSETNNGLIGFTSFKNGTSRLKKFLNHFPFTKMRGDEDET